MLWRKLKKGKNTHAKIRGKEPFRQRGKPVKAVGWNIPGRFEEKKVKAEWLDLKERRGDKYETVSRRWGNQITGVLMTMVRHLGVHLRDTNIRSWRQWCHMSDWHTVQNISGCISEDFGGQECQQRDQLGVRDTFFKKHLTLVDSRIAFHSAEA